MFVWTWIADWTHSFIVYCFFFVLLVTSSKGSDDIQAGLGLIMMLWASFVAGLMSQQEECHNSCENSHWYVNADTLFSAARLKFILLELVTVQQQISDSYIVTKGHGRKETSEL
ncbi:hypothetical protein Tco_1394752 [Tanacetum coccineum]